MIEACKQGDEKAVVALLKQGAKTDMPNEKGEQPLGAAVWGMCPDVVNALLKQAGGVAPMAWEECEQHNLKHYKEVFIVPKFDPQTYGEWRQLLQNIDPNPFIRAYHLKKVDEQWHDAESSSWERFKGHVESVAGFADYLHVDRRGREDPRPTEMGLVSYRSQIKQAIETASCPKISLDLLNSSSASLSPTQVISSKENKSLPSSSQSSQILMPMPKQTPKTVDKIALSQLLQYVVEGEQDKAEALIQKDKNLLLHAGTVKDLSGREFKQIAAFQYALWAMDYHMWTMIKQYLPREAQVEQLRALEMKGTAHGKHFSFKDLTNALQTYLDNYNSYSWNIDIFGLKIFVRKHEHYWQTVVGGAQRMLPAHVVNEYCRPDTIRGWDQFASLPLRVRNCDRVGDWFTGSYNGGKLGEKFAVLRGMGPKCYVPVAVPDDYNWPAWQIHEGVMSAVPLTMVSYDLKGLLALFKTRMQELQLLKSELLSKVSYSQGLELSR